MTFFVFNDQIQKIFLNIELKVKMSSVMQFPLKRVELYVVTINDRPWTRVKEVSRALEYNKNTAHVIKTFCSSENITQKYQMSSVNWPKDSQKYDIYIDEKGMYEVLF